MDISLHFDFFNNELFFDVNKANLLFKIANDFNIRHFNTYGNTKIYPTDEDDPKDIEFANNLKLLATKYNMKCSSFHFNGSVLDAENYDQSRVRNIIARSLKINSVFNPKVFVVHPGTYSDGGFPKNKIVYNEYVKKYGIEQTHNIIVNNFKFFGEEAKKYNINVAIENIFGGRYYSKIDDLINLVNDINMDNVGWCLDIGHANFDSVDIVKTINLMSNKLFEVHMHDNNGTKDQHLPIGFGTIDWISVIKALKDASYNGTATFEYFRWPYHEYYDGIKYSVEMVRTIEKIIENGYWTLDWK